MGLGRGSVMRLEVPVDLGAQVVVVIGRPVHVLRRQQGQAKYAQRPQASRHTPQNRTRHLKQYIGENAR